MVLVLWNLWGIYMKIKLYKPFEHWYRGGTIWLISDTHFDDTDCSVMSDHWPTPEEQVNLINRFVGKNDTLIHLGDVGNPEWISKLKGYKVLLLGNHDKGVSNYEKKWYISVTKEDKFDREFSSYEEAIEYIDEMNGDGIDTQGLRVISNGLFDEVYDGPLFINDKICLSHEPIDLKFGINIHGHVHQGEQSIYRTDQCADINITADVREFQPIRIDDLISEYKTTSLHRLTIEKAKRNPLHKEK